MPEKSRREELLEDPALTLRSPELTEEFIAEHTELMNRFGPLSEKIKDGTIDPAAVALTVLKEHARLYRKK